MTDQMARLQQEAEKRWPVPEYLIGTSAHHRIDDLRIALEAAGLVVEE